MLDVVTILQWRFQTQDLTNTLVTKRDFSRKTNLWDNQRHQMATLAWVAFCTVKQKREEAVCLVCHVCLEVFATSRYQKLERNSCLFLGLFFFRFHQ